MHELKNYTDLLFTPSTITEFDHMCKIFLDPYVKDISPLLRHYDLIEQNTIVKLNIRNMLELD